MNQQLIEQFLTAKTAEATAIAARVALGDAIAAQLEHPDDGSKTHTVGEYKVVVKGVVNRRADWEAIDALRLGDKSPEKKPKRELDMKGVAWWETEDPATHRAILRAITATPGRTQVTIEEKTK